MDEELVITKNESETLVIEKNVDSITTKINQANAIAAVDEVK